jgi:hypothetical protein
MPATNFTQHPGGYLHAQTLPFPPSPSVFPALQTQDKPMKSLILKSWIWRSTKSYGIILSRGYDAREMTEKFQGFGWFWFRNRKNARYKLRATHRRLVLRSNTTVSIGSERIPGLVNMRQTYQKLDFETWDLENLLNHLNFRTRDWDTRDSSTKVTSWDFD